MKEMIELCRVCQENKLSLGALHLLLTIAEYGYETRMGELAKNLRRDYANVTVIADGLERRGLVSRRRGLKDRRKVYCVLTREGEKLLSLIWYVVNKLG